jgi:ribosome-associated translation inhibitor RaiA
MSFPLKVTFRHVDPSPALRERIDTLATRLEKFSAQILRCHVVIEAPAGHHQQGELFHVSVELSVPGRQIVIRRARPNDPAHEDPYVALRDAFQAARRKLQDYARERRHEVKRHSPVSQGSIRELHPAQGFGRIETPEGRLIYFHQNSVLDHSFAKLVVGTPVRFAEEPGERGPQASTVYVLA